MENTHTWTCQNDLGMTVQEYASTYKLSYETVRAKIIRYKEELEGHIKIRKKNKISGRFCSRIFREPPETQIRIFR